MHWQGNAFREWFKVQEQTLHRQAALAGLLQHSSAVGTAREFLVKRVLQAVLPPTVHFGTDIIVDANDKASKQIDVILYDSRFPVMEFERGVGVYPIEGVIATIEVNTSLASAEKLDGALENCLSVVSLNCASPNMHSAIQGSSGFSVASPGLTGVSAGGKLRFLGAADAGLFSCSLCPAVGAQ